MRAFGGLTYPLDGEPAFFCMITEKVENPDLIADKQKATLTISDEIESHSLLELYTKLKDIKGLQAIYAPNNNKYASYIREFSRWRREENSKLQLRTTQISSFEAGILKIKELITKKELVFPEDSKIKAQLRILSKLSFKDNAEYYAVSALCNVVGAFRRNTGGVKQETPKLKAWY